MTESILVLKLKNGELWICVLESETETSVEVSNTMNYVPLDYDGSQAMALIPLLPFDLYGEKITIRKDDLLFSYPAPDILCELFNSKVEETQFILATFLQRYHDLKAQKSKNKEEVFH